MYQPVFQDGLEKPDQSLSLKVLLVHPGTQYSFKLAEQLHRFGCLSRLWTGMAYIHDSPLGRFVQCLPIQVQRQLSNRRLDGLPTNKVCTRPLLELRALRRLRAGDDEQTVMFARNAAFQDQIPDQEFVESNVVIGFDTASWLIGHRSLALGRRFVLDRSIGHPHSFQQILPMLQAQFPEWVENFPNRVPELSRAEKTEHDEAHLIVVPSSFAGSTLIENGVPANKIKVIPFGVDLNAFRPIPRPDLPRPFRFVFLGSLGARKGVPLLLQAWSSLVKHDAELWLVGPIKERHARLIPPLRGLRLIGKVPHRELPALLRQCDVLVFPSYFEGLAQVQLEALACGLPIIATEATGATDLITNGMEGYIIPVGDVEALIEAMQRFVNSPGDLALMSPSARRCAERYSWDAYGDRWMEILRQVIA